MLPSPQLPKPNAIITELLIQELIASFDISGSMDLLLSGNSRDLDHLSVRIIRELIPFSGIHTDEPHNDEYSVSQEPCEPERLGI
jgi:hypothetical protein